MQASSYNIALNQCVSLNHVEEHVKNYRSVKGCDDTHTVGLLYQIREMFYYFFVFGSGVPIKRKSNCHTLTEHNGSTADLYAPKFPLSLSCVHMMKEWEAV